VCSAPAFAARPTLLFYCQHSLGIGHLTRSFALVHALTKCFRVVFLNGGRLPPNIHVPPDCELIDLPPLGMDDGHTVVSRDASHDLAQAQAKRRALIERCALTLRPAVLLVELFPFGRKKFAGEILSMIRLTRRQSGARAMVVCSLRDILVDVRPDQQLHDERARWLADRYFDAVLVHADPGFARLGDSFRPRRPLRTSVHYTGYVVPTRPAANVASADQRGSHLLVSAAGGIVGSRLFHAALQARTLLQHPLPIRVIAGPFLPDAHWAALQHAADGVPGVDLLRRVPDMVAQMRTARASLSQCGYNTALDIVVSGVPALVVPYQTPTENEQHERATRLAALGTLLHLSEAELTPQCLAAEIGTLMRFSPRPAALDLDGATRSTELLDQLLWAGIHARGNSYVNTP